MSKRNFNHDAKVLRRRQKARLERRLLLAIADDNLVLVRFYEQQLVPYIVEAVADRMQT